MDDVGTELLFVLYTCCLKLCVYEDRGLQFVCLYMQLTVPVGCVGFF
jgi:hypothetical protein